jgi:putative ABC transport system ATP-binding protein
MSDDRPLIEIQGVGKDHGGDRPLRIQSLSVGARDRVTLSGLNRAEAETLIHLVSGAAVPDTGSVMVAGTDTRSIVTDTEWLVSLDRFGVVTHRAVLLDSLSIAANLALPISLAVDPMPPPVRAAVDDLALAAGLDRATLDRPVSSLDAFGRARLHLARALATSPRLLLLEHPTLELTDEAERQALGRTLRQVADARGLGWLAISDDERFSRSAGGHVWRLAPGTGVLTRRRSWWPWG